MSKEILVVEDDQDARTALCAMLEGLGFTSLAFESGKDALNGIIGKQVRLALLDVMMPEMNGYELLTKLKEKAEFKNVPVIMVTARDADDQVLEGYQYGADYYITKPYTMDQLKYGIQMCLEP